MSITNSDFNDHLNRILGAILQAGWFLYIGLSLSLALDRLLYFVVSRNFYIVTVAVLVLSWLISLGFLVAFLTPGYSFGYCCTNQYLRWFYSHESGAQFLKNIEVYLDFVVLSLVLVVYICVFGCLLKLRSKGSGFVASQSLKVEVRILFVSIATFIYEGTYVLWFFWGSTFLSDNSYTHVITTALWIIDCGFFSFATIGLNTSVRKRIKTLVQPRKTTTVTRF
ncbi:hypothetical protein L596_030512 [Steinernema carpocapsae]|uniref:7TM GPCR serpentine receptor class x (Srx) domain-containing protein n=1 Tax=Steinernema carpocapsae TaxID=34508 RepID=A0A4U5LPK9_STECR|nr:hypothetical protein L596_030512 [Steinernema carpocapsae]